MVMMNPRSGDCYLVAVEEAPDLIGNSFEVSERQLGFRLTRSIIRFFGEMYNLDYFDPRIRQVAHHSEQHTDAHDDDDDDDEQQQHQRQTTPPCPPPGDRSSVRRGRAPTRKRWSLICLVLYCITSSSMFCNVYFQYIYDVNLYRYQHQLLLAATVAAAPKSPASSTQAATTPHQLNSTLSRLEADIEGARRALRFVGAPLLNVHFAIEVAYLFVLIVSSCIYGQGQLLLRYRFPVNFRLARLIVDPDRERRMVTQLIKNEVLKYYASSLQFNEAKRAQQASSLSCRYYSHGRYLSLHHHHHNNNNNNNLHSSKHLQHHHQQQQHQHQSHQSMLDLLESMALSGSLRPLTWTTQYMARSVRLFGLSVVSFTVAGMLIFVVVTSIIAPLVGVQAYLEPQDVLFLLQEAVLVFILASSVFYFSAYALFTVMEQSEYLRLLIRLVEYCIANNRCHSEQILVIIGARGELLAPSGGRLGPGPEDAAWRLELHLKRRQMNLNMLHCFMHYKIFVAQHRQSDAAFRGTIMVMTFLLLTMPILIRIHVPYMGNQVFKLVAAVVCLTTAAVYNCIAIPVCNFHSRSLDLYRALNSLMVHSIELAHRSMPTLDCPPTIYDRHLISLLQKELHHPARMITQFATIILGIKFTYPTLVKFHFWFGILVISITLSVDSSSTDPFARFINDPFRVYRFPMDE